MDRQMGAKIEECELSVDTRADYLASAYLLMSTWPENQVVQQGPKEMRRLPYGASEHGFGVLVFVSFNASQRCR